MLQYCINLFFAVTAVIAIFIVFDSCRKAISEYRLLMRERVLMGPIWTEIEPGIEPPWDCRRPGSSSYAAIGVSSSMAS